MNTKNLKPTRWLSLLLIASFALSTLSAVASDTVTGKPQKKPIALVGGTVHTVSGEVIEKGTVLFDKGKIVAVGTDVAIPKSAEVINVEGKQVYPGLIESHSQIGLVEIGAVSATIDRSEIGSFNPNVKAQIAVNPDSEVIPVTRSNGVLVALTVPSGGLVSGKAALIQLDGWTYEDLTLTAEAAMQINWPRSGRRRFRRSTTPSSSNPTKELAKFFDQAKAYMEASDADDTIFTVKDPQKFDIRLEAMKPVLKGEMPVIIAADGLSEIQAAVAFAVERKLKLIIFGGYDAEACADLLKKHDVPVILSAIYRNPAQRHDDYDASYTLPNRLMKAGVKYCISGADRSETWNVRILPDHAATAVAYGLPKDEALKAITLYPAEILGAEKKIGSIEKGKDATIFISNGDIFEISSRVELAFVQGRKLDLSDRHKRLYEKYQNRYDKPGRKGKKSK